MEPTMTQDYVPTPRDISKAAVHMRDVYSKFVTMVGTPDSKMELLEAIQGRTAGYAFVILKGRFWKEEFLGTVMLTPLGGSTMRLSFDVTKEATGVYHRGPWHMDVSGVTNINRLVEEATYIVLNWMQHWGQ